MATTFHPGGDPNITISVWSDFNTFGTIQDNAGNVVQLNGDGSFTLTGVPVNPGTVPDQQGVNGLQGFACNGITTASDI